MLVGITQRVETYQKLDETRDCLDQRWTKVYVRQILILD